VPLKKCFLSLRQTALLSAEGKKAFQKTKLDVIIRKKVSCLISQDFRDFPQEMGNAKRPGFQQNRDREIPGCKA
jgi:hypothetical protein